MILPAPRADYRALGRYRYRPGSPLDRPVTAFTGDRDPRAGVEEARAWHARTTAGFGLHVLDGGHFFLVGRRAEMLRVLTERLERAAAPAAAS